MKWLQEQSETMGSNVKCREIQLTHLYDKFENVFDSVSAREFQNELGFANSRARLRMTTLYQVATACNGIVVGTGNKVEDFGVGFYTKYGDGGVDISPIADLTKTEVREMASALGIISEILNAKPTDGLWGDDRSDEDQLGATYPELEWAMQYVASGNTDQTHLSERELQVLHIYNNLHRKNLHKMIPIPVFNND
jgi:NAD+ synthase